jgi:hypothetical protein
MAVLEKLLSISAQQTAVQLGRSIDRMQIQGGTKLQGSLQKSRCGFTAGYHCPRTVTAQQPAAVPKSSIGAKPSVPPSQQPDSKDDSVEVPAVGWMWQKDGAASRKQPSAAATVANLRADRIDAKK